MSAARLFFAACQVLAGERRSSRAIAAIFKMGGYRLERRYPFLMRAPAEKLNLDFNDILALQYARSRRFMALIVGAYDGFSNDPSGAFLAEKADFALWLEPQPAAFLSLMRWLPQRPGLLALRAAVDERDGERTMYVVANDDGRLPAWVGQLASFDHNHIAKHEDRAPGVTAATRTLQVETICFASLLHRFGIAKLDLLQIDVEGMDAQLLEWFPFDTVRPGIVCYEAAHLSGDLRRAARDRLRRYGYRFPLSPTGDDEVAVRV